MMVRDKRDIKPALLKFGVALALSLAGFLYSQIKRRRNRSRPQLPPPNSRPSDEGNEVNSEAQIAGLKNDLQLAATTHGSRIIMSTTVEKNDETYIRRVHVNPSVVVHSPSSGHSGDRGGLLLPEFDDLVKELDFSGCDSGISPKKDVETPSSDVETPRSVVTTEREVYEQEIMHLRNTVRMLTERERSLEVQLLEYYGLKEQETAVMELQNQLKINNMEAKLFCMKIESLQAENQRLEAKVADYAKVVADLETARSKIRFLKRKLKSEAEQNREQILLLQKRVAKFQDQELKSVTADTDMRANMQKIKHLQHEIEELKKTNVELELENSDLARRLESTQLLANCVLEDPEAEALKREGDHLRREIESLTKEVAQLQADRCADVEELVYLRWINACLRYELRNYQPPPGKTAARDLSKTLSPKSEEKAKQLILDYANTEGMADKGINFLDFDSDQWSSSQASYLTDSGECDDTSVDTPSGVKKKNRLFGKLRRLVLGKDSHEENRRSSVEKTESLEMGTGGFSFESSHGSSSRLTREDSGTNWSSSRYTTPCRSLSSRRSLDIQRLRSFKYDEAKDEERLRRNSSDVNSSDASSTDHLKDGQPCQESESFQKNELAKYAKVLKDSRRGTPSGHKKSASFSSLTF